MRPIAELIEFLTHTMTLMTVYQPAVILHVLKREGVASRADLARMLSGNEVWELEFWDRVLMKNPKLILVTRHQILKYDKATQTFFLNFELTDTEAIEQATAICEQKIEGWIQKAVHSNKVTEAEGWRLYRVLEIARRGNQYRLPDTAPDQLPEDTLKTNIQLEEFAMRIAVQELGQRYPDDKVTQQPHNNFGFDILVGTLDRPIAYVRVKATQGYQPTFYISEGERQFSIDHADRYILVIVYAIHLCEETYKIALQLGRIDLNTFKLIPIAVPLNMRYTLDRQGKGFSLLFVPHQIGNRYMYWQAKLLNADQASTVRCL